MSQVKTIVCYMFVNRLHLFYIIDGKMNWKISNLYGRTRARIKQKYGCDTTSSNFDYNKEKKRNYSFD